MPDFISVASLASVPKGIERDDPAAIVSAVGERDAGIEFRDRKHLRLVFADVERPVVYGPRYTARGMTAEQMARFLDFVAGVSSGGLLIHCVQGISRSPALAIAALIASGLSAEAAALAVAAACPLASPNRWVLLLAGEQLAIGEQAVDAAETHFTIRRDRNGLAVGVEAPLSDRLNIGNQVCRRSSLE